MNDRPATVLERAIARGRQGDLDPGSVLWVLAADSVVILHEGELIEGEFPSRPLVVDNGERQFLAVFTHQDFCGSFLEGRTPVLVPALELMKRIPSEVGVVINPGMQLGLEVPALGIRGFTQMLLQTELNS